MTFRTRLLSLAGLAMALACATQAARAQEAAPAPTSTPTLMDRQYDGNWHLTLAPYVWLPTVKGNFQYSIPTLSRHGGGVIQPSVGVGPSDYLSNINSTVMFSVDARKGAFDVFGDYIYLNATASASAYTTVTGPHGRVQIPVSFGTDARLATSIWEAALGYTVARGHNADLSAFWGIRSFPATVTLGYNATIGRRGLINPSGTVRSASYLSDTVFGLRGKAFLGDSRWYVPYYADIGTSINQVPNQTWEAYSGLGYGFNHGQTLLATYRALNYSGFAPGSFVQKMSLYGPLVGYTFNL